MFVIFLPEVERWAWEAVLKYYYLFFFFFFNLKKDRLPNQAALTKFFAVFIFWKGDGKAKYSWELLS